MLTDIYSVFHCGNEFILSSHTLTDIVLHCIVCPQTHYISLSVKICTYDARGVFELLNFHDQELMFDHCAVIQKQNAVEEAEELEPEPKNRTVTVSEFRVDRRAWTY